MEWRFAMMGYVECVSAGEVIMMAWEKICAFRKWVMLKGCRLLPNDGREYCRGIEVKR